MIDLTKVDWANMAQETQGRNNDANETGLRDNRIVLRENELKAIRKGLEHHNLLTKKNGVRHTKMDALFQDNIKASSI